MPVGGSNQGDGGTLTPLATEMAAYDLLPPEAREYISTCRHKVSAHATMIAWLAWGRRFGAAHFVGELDRRVRQLDAAKEARLRAEMERWLQERADAAKMRAWKPESPQQG